MKRGQHDRKRGRHKKRASAETQAWNREHVAPAPPAWMSPDTARDLLRLRRQLDPLA